MTATETSTLADFVRAAAYQRRLMIPWLEDKLFVKEGGRILYAVDTNVIVLYTNPELESIARFARVFPNDDIGLTSAISRAVANYIFFELDPENVLLVIPPMEQEMRRVFQAVTRGAQDEFGHAQDEIVRLKTLLETLKQSDNHTLVLARLRRETPTLARVLGGRRGYAAELQRFAQLLSKSRIAPVSFALENDWIKDRTLAAAVAAPSTLVDIAAVRDLREIWFARLTGTKSGTSSRILIYADAEMLAYLEWVNRNLPEDRRLVLITRDHAIHEAARGYIPPSAKVPFSDLYLRHPRAYLAESSVFSPQESSSSTGSSHDTQFLKWLDTFLAELGTRQERYQAALDHLLSRTDGALEGEVKEVLDIRPRLMRDFRSSWESHTQNLVLSHSARDSIFDTEDKLLRSVASDVQTLIGKVQRLLSDRIRKDWEACFEAATDAGYGLLVHRAVSSGMPPRNPPVLSFDSFQHFQSFTHKVLRVRRESSADIADYKKRISEVYNIELPIVMKEDKSGYTRFLAYALFFAAEQSWRVASILAEVAMDIAQNERPPYITGREAAYLGAVALRHCAGRVSDLEEVAPLLDRAEECLAQDRAKRPALQAGEVRFPAERIALDLTYHLFRRFAQQLIPDRIPPLARIQARIEELLQRIDETISAMNQSERERLIAVKVERNLLTNLFMTALLMWSENAKSVDTLSLQKYLTRYSRSLKHDTLPSTFLAQGVFLTASWWLAEDSRQKRASKRKLSEHFMGNVIMENSVLPYDADRFAFLRDLPEH